MMPTSAAIHRLSNELLKDILDCVGADPDPTVNIDHRAYLSVESFRPPNPPPPLPAHDIANFRLVCRRWADLGIPHQFTRIATRFSVKGLQRLEGICAHPHLARQTKKFSYMIPDFYVEGRERVREFLPLTNGDFRASDAQRLEQKADEQRRIVKSGEDLRVLRRAMAAFTSLQHVQILRLQDETDRFLLEYLGESDEDLTRLVDLRWAPACTHAMRTLAEALAAAHSPLSRFSAPMLSAHSAIALQDRLPPNFATLAEKITCLELHFEDGPELAHNIPQLSRSFKAVFTAARNIQAVHVGFPSRKPMDLSLEQVFHHVHWEKLRAFGVQAWRLEGAEIIELARRHKRTLRGLRLRDVQLRPGSWWQDVLKMLRAEMEQLEWVSLRRIDYAEHFDEMWGSAIEVPDHHPGAASESDDDDDDFQSHLSFEDEAFDGGTDDESEPGSVESMDEGPEANELELSSPVTPPSLPFCTCTNATAGDLSDDGRAVGYHQRKAWEKWVIGRCPEHSSLD